MVRYLSFILAFALGLSLTATAQSEEDESFENELSYGVNFNSNGGLIGGVFVRSVYPMNNRMYQFGGLEIVEIKHPKENRLYSETGDQFIAGKQNYLFVIRPHYGREFVLFRKAAESGVQVNAIAAAGPSLGLLAPYYIRYNYGGPGGEDIRTEQYDPQKHRSLENIMGNGTVFQGLSESNVNFGAHIKGGLSFEYGRYRESIAGIEVGFMLELFPKEMVIIPQAENEQLFTSVYLNLYYGRRK
ncbi:hypothetical protein ABID22_001038 [Pontibacter aydingkolensis]|uniref:hypothetical protein n=1 Tax=Pontibacter aydingkolensis TaxID=1911536 RepID=UPI00293D55C1|nr:hypothetical protein [Pontibacter aydingkolensis]